MASAPGWRRAQAARFSSAGVPRAGSVFPRKRANAAPASPVSVAALRRRLPAGALDLDPVPRALLVRPGRRARRAEARAGSPEGGGKRSRTKPDQAAAARGLAREARA